MPQFSSSSTHTTQPQTHPMQPRFRFWFRWFRSIVQSVLAIGLGMILMMNLAISPAQALTEDQRLVNEVWRIIDRAYVDASFNHQNWWALREKYLKKNMPDRATTYQLIRDMLGVLGDPFTRVMEPEQYSTLR